jgi:hypothetical protein
VQLGAVVKNRPGQLPGCRGPTPVPGGGRGIRGRFHAFPPAPLCAGVDPGRLFRGGQPHVPHPGSILSSVVQKGGGARGVARNEKQGLQRLPGGGSAGPACAKRPYSRQL